MISCWQNRIEWTTVVLFKNTASENTLSASLFYPEQAASAYLSDNRNQAFADAGFDMVVYTPVPTRGISIEERKNTNTERLIRCMAAE